ncbi:hypothetical protein CYLTODRAFT_427673 [Cylindrobasidium torrendii FP15055 ss-10]|uniref:DUF6987 domain-containing protein n=1 Tax=Cylindrobasidium torrendii FP15055 ss-10 TaxID=1314674 RepID=A0A0D7AV16_9AGAR|nr:hypothetical protein CYLTODRAFT_427673 [Cylindrobasidium torrendii FP15055 ss-10]
MFFTRFAAAFTLGSALFAAAAPTPRALDVGSEVTSILGDLQGVTNAVLPEICSSSALTEITEETALPLVQKLADALTTASSSLTGLTSSANSTAGGLLGRDGKEEVAQLLNTVISDATNTLNPIVGELQKIPAVKELLTTLSPVLNTVLSTVDSLLPGVLSLVSGLLGPVLDVLKGLGLGNLLGGLLGGL